MSQIDLLYNSLAAGAADQQAGHAHLLTRAEQLCVAQESITPEHSNEQVHTLFARNEALETVAVNESGVPIGLINRHQFMEQYARPFGRDVFGRKSCIAFMDKSPVVVDAATPIETLVKVAVEAGARVLRDGFIATSNGRYVGMGTGYALMKAMSDIETEKTRQLLASIAYASLIQRSHLAESDRDLRGALPDHGLVWEPRDVVGGDAYFFRETPQGLLGCLFDCTGHGVPGAFMTLIVLSFLEQFTAAHTQAQPGEVLTQMNIYLKRVLQQRADGATADHKDANDGLDAAIFLLSPDRGSMRFASAKLSLFIARPGDDAIQVAEGDKAGIGYSDTADDQVWATHALQLAPGSMVMVCTDGVIDQIGGAKQIAHGKRRLVQFMAEHRAHGAAALCQAFTSAFSEWQGEQRRRDDVSLLAFTAQPL
ncbi:SpoIIE family protein phosphatase [Ramlibacter sp. H39-3-26]|uniref:SpoIIE family protein phosphatase n=1 Tax=Curvibacter soli TaxID=3031331 RepID=UPI0023DA53C1|nr:SpoIIE family protein phosphatase [Ramlibacter sp. H39-3-26]MDF1484855.1 SpoIIE family protein phosphatase [Ramlibacter sp. H39-3-26]